MRRGDNILIFSEGTWNLTSNLIMLTMRWGVIDMAVQAHAQIVPVILEYDYDAGKCYVKFGDPVICRSAEDKTQAIRSLRDNMASLSWDIWEMRGIKRRRLIYYGI